ncbi:NAD-binding protein [Mrakia frigida]|uniref:NAD-binding protein n=1 Tax=Mrakia frigida TaxID=29902 RepID=UPI003FCBF7FF
MASLTLNMLWNQCLPSKPTWSIDEIPDLTGKVAAVTGGYGGVGLETVKALLKKNAHVYILGRSTSKGEEAISKLKDVGGTVEFIVVDLEDLASVRKGAEELASKTSHLEMLFNNAGVMFPAASAITKHGHDLQFGCNVLGHYHLTTILLPVLLASPFKAEGFPRVVNTSSSGHLGAPKGGIIFDNLKVVEGTDRPKVGLGVHARYFQSKIGNVIFANELQKRYASQGLVSTSCNPGNLNSDLWRNTGPLQKVLGAFTYPPAMGALTQLFLGTTVEGKDLGGKYYVPWARPGPTRPEATDEEIQAKLWAWCEKECEGF